MACASRLAPTFTSWSKAPAKTGPHHEAFRFGKLFNEAMIKKKQRQMKINDNGLKIRQFSIVPVDLERPKGDSNIFWNLVLDMGTMLDLNHVPFSILEPGSQKRKVVLSSSDFRIWGCQTWKSENQIVLWQTSEWLCMSSRMDRPLHPSRVPSQTA